MLPRIVLAISLALIPAASAAPATTYAYSPELAAFYSAISKQIASVKNTKAPFQCDMAQANLNFPQAPTALPAANDGATLKHVVLGFGTQNYTCPTSAAKLANATLSSSAPVAAGAFAQLFNVSCIAANYPDILATLPGLAMQYQLPSSYFPPAGTIGQDAPETPNADYSYQPLNVVYAGLHTFADLTTPRFNLDVVGGGQNGLIYAKKFASTPAWANATKGAFGAVPYLRLDATTGTVGGYSHVFRMQTAGGMQPADCSGNAGLFTMPYSATYWFYGK